jgi:hypothetical protein
MRPRDPDDLRADPSLAELGLIRAGKDIRLAYGHLESPTGGARRPD